MVQPRLSTRKQRVLEALNGQPEGLSLQEIRQRADLGDLSPQAVRRLLLELARLGALSPEGRTRNRRYQVASEPHDVRAEPGLGAEPTDEEAYPPISAEGRQCREILNRPLARRTPVSYRRAFLDAYLPNETSYLGPELRERLAVLGGPRGPEAPAGTYARQILERLLIDLSWNSSRLEGNTYSLLDTERLIGLGQRAEGKDLLETQMILNHKAAIEYLVASAEEIAPDPATLQNLHALLMDNLLADPMDEGRLRTTPVGIHGTSYLPLGVPQVIEECFRQILHLASEIEDPFEQSLFLLVHVSYLQPFRDGNKRTARLAANIPLIRRNCIPITFMDIPARAFTDGVLAVYELNRVELLRDIFAFACERSYTRYQTVTSSLGEPDPFRLHYRTEIKALVRDLVLAGVAPEASLPQIRAYAETHLPKESWARFQTVVKTELAGLHEGNHARYQLRPSEFAEWKRRTTQEG